jgi:hypothetical protein
MTFAISVQKVSNMKNKDRGNIGYIIHLQSDEVEYIKDTLKMLPFDFIHEAIQKHIATKPRPAKKRQKDIVLTGDKYDLAISPVLKVVPLSTLTTTEEQERELETSEEQEDN